MKKLTLLFIFSVTLNCFAFAQNDGIINLKKGEKFILESKIVSTTSMDMLGQTMETKSEMNSFYNIEVKDIKGDVYTIIINNTREIMSGTAMGQDMSFDSDKKEDLDGNMGSAFKNKINIPHDVFMTRSGKIIVDEKNDTAAIEDNKNPMMQIMKQFNTNPEKAGYGVMQAFKVVTKNLKTGYSWKDSSTSEMIQGFTTYTISEIKNGEVTINSSGIDNTDVKQQVQGMEITGKLSGTSTGTEIVNIATGVIKETNSTMNAKGTMSVMGQEIPMTIKTISTTTVKPL